MAVNSFGARGELTVGQRTFEIFRLDALEPAFDVGGLPFSLKILLENLLRTEGNGAVDAADIEALAGWDPAAVPSKEIAFTPARVLMQDFTGVPAVVDLAAMRDAMAAMGGDPAKINPLVPAELVIDHSVQVDVSGTRDAFRRNAEREFERNEERYAFLRWGQDAFRRFKVVPPDTGIVHQVNLEYLARVVFVDDATDRAYPDTLVGTDSHTTMVNGLGVLGWGVGGIEAEAAMLGQPMPMLIPQVVGFRLHGRLPEGATATDLVLTVTQQLRSHGVVGKFVEFYGAGLANLPLADRATIGNMSPEFGSTCAIFPIDRETLRYLELSGRPAEQIELVEAYARAQGLWHDDELGGAGLLRAARARPGGRRPEHRRTEAAAGPGQAERGRRRRSGGRCRITYLTTSTPTRGRFSSQETGSWMSFPASDPPSNADPGPHAAAMARLAAEASRVREDGVHDGAAGGHPRAPASGRRAGDRAQPRARGDRGDHELHEHVESVGDDGRRDPRAERGRPRAADPAVGQDVARAGLEGRHRVPRPGRADRAARDAGIPPRRLRLHDVHRQLRAARAGDLGGGQRERPRGRLGPLGQPELRGPDQRRREAQLSRLAAVVRRLRAGRVDGLRHRRRPARCRRGRDAGLPARHLADRAGGRRGSRARRSTRTCSARATARSSTGTSGGRGS